MGSGIALRSGRAEGGFTLVELLAVIVIILIVSVVALPMVLSGLSARQVREAARILQAELAGARDSAIRRNAPSGLRLLPSPGFSGINSSTGLLDPTLPLAADKIIPIETAPDYSEGFVSSNFPPSNLSVPYPGPGGGFYPLHAPNSSVLMIEESAYAPTSDPNVWIPNAPTSWFWNLRVGDAIQINQVGPWFRIVGPMAVTPADGNPEMFVNVGPPGTRSSLVRFLINSTGAVVYYPDFLLLVNTLDDNANGWTDEGWDGVDNNGDGNIDELAEWESEVWPSSLFSQTTVIQNQPYRVRRRPAPVASGRTTFLPTNVVIDLTTWGTTRERSRLPVNPFTGHVDFLVNPSGEVVPTTIYSTPASFGMSRAFYHFWLAERSDVYSPDQATAAPLLPLPVGVGPAPSTGRQIEGTYGLLTLFTRTGLVTSNLNMPFDNPAAPADGVSYNPNLPFLGSQAGAAGGW
jgi:prepilin-type N-terminal cleavage/methylation domain-containing protein